MDEAKREKLGKMVREEWVKWAKEQPNPKPSWLVPWDDLSEPDREVDRRIGERLYSAGAHDTRHKAGTSFVVIKKESPAETVFAFLQAEYGATLEQFVAWLKQREMR